MSFYLTTRRSHSIIDEQMICQIAYQLNATTQLYQQLSSILSSTKSRIPSYCDSDVQAVNASKRHDRI
ncbi:hypothetical protein Mapa_007394 [Marchantia paleacea]|nr:hypothetical protein Mapa_007394 [Marchantia paleacea]